MSLLETANGLWHEAYKRLHSEERADLEMAFKCLYSGVELVLPTMWEVKFRLLLARFLQIHTTETAEASEQIRKALHLTHSRGDCPINLRLLALSMWSMDLMTPETSRVKNLLEGRRIAIEIGDTAWWMHFDWIAWKLGLTDIISDSLERLERMGEVTSTAQLTDDLTMVVIECKLFLQSLTSHRSEQEKSNIGDIELLLSSTDASIITQSSTIYLLASLICLKEHVERGEAKKARISYEKCQLLIDQIDGTLPGLLRINPQAIKQWWIKLTNLINLRSGEAPNEMLDDIFSDEAAKFKDPLKVQTTTNNSNNNNDDDHHDGDDDGNNDNKQRRRKRRDTEYESTLQQLLSLVKNTRSDPQSVLSSVGNDEFKDLCPQLESLRLLVHAVASYQAKEPVHRTKASLLEALKLLNGTTQNTMMKVITLLLVGQLYLDTDFEMSLKMNQAALSFANTAQWDFFAKVATRNIAEANRRLRR